MENVTMLIVGVIAGFLLGLAMLWAFDRKHRRTMKKLVESRRKIERQRTQAVNDLFALRAEIEDGRFMTGEHAAIGSGINSGAAEPDPQLVAEVSTLRSLIARADGALTAARRKRDQNEAEIARLRHLLEEAKNENVIDLRRQDRSGGSQGNLAL